jgi:spore maturation protein CgeB
MSTVASAQTAGAGTTFDEATAAIGALLAREDAAGAAAAATEYLARIGERPQRLLLEGLRCSLSGAHADALRAFREAGEVLVASALPALDTPYSTAYVASQMRIPAHESPALAEGLRNYGRNLVRLREVDPALAAEVETCPWPAGYRLVEFWGGLHLYAPGARRLLVMSPSVERELAGIVARREAIAFAGVGTGREIGYCLAHRADFLHGMTRAHFLFEPKAELVKALLFLRDMRAALAARELIIFGGARFLERAREVFGTLRYSMPTVVIGDPALVEPYTTAISWELTASGAKERAKSYYASAEFKERLRSIAAGQCAPRVLVFTCRWTTFLKYCAADFERAFAKNGCETRFLIEEDDSQTLQPALVWRELAACKPDAVFMVSHARPSLAYVPRELPFISYVQDKCGPLLALSDLLPHVAPRDLFVCLYLEHQRFVVDKGVAPEQTFVMPVPVDETMFYPLPRAHPKAAEFTVDASFVKHGVAHVEEAYRRYCAAMFAGAPATPARQVWTRIVQDLYRETCARVDRCWYEDEMEELVLSRVAPASREALRPALRQQIASFHCEVYAPAWRFQFLEALDQAGIELALYGKNWEQNERLRQLGRGPAERERDLNYVYNFTRVNLSINHSGSMTARLVECALAGGFIMAAAHRAEKDYLPASWYFEPGKELVFFESTADVVERCRHYLAHEDERTAIAQRMRERALREQTCTAGAAKVLAQFRALLAQTLGGEA